MNTVNENVLNAVVTVLLDNKLTVNEQRMTALTTAINRALPVASPKLTEETRALLPSLSGGAIFDSLTDDIVIHIPSFYRSTKTVDNTGKDEFFVAKHRVIFKLDSYSLESVRFFSLTVEGLCVQPDYNNTIPAAHNANCKLTELVDTVIPVLKGLQSVTTSASAASVDYNAVVSTFGLDSFKLPCVTWENYYKGDNEKGICGITALLELSDSNINEVNNSCDRIESLCVVSKKKNESNVFYYTASNGTVWEIIQSVKTERVGRGSKDIAYRYQFRVSKSVIVKAPMIDVNFEL